MTFLKGPYAGGVPFGIVSPNITDMKTGIGRFDFAAFDKTVRQGISPRGPMSVMMPPSYAIMTDEDVHDLYNFFMHGVQPIDNTVSQPDKPVSEAAPERSGPLPPPPAKTERWRAAVTWWKDWATVVRHTPRAVQGVEKAQWASQGKDFLSGGGNYADLMNYGETIRTGWPDAAWRT